MLPMQNTGALGPKREQEIIDNFSTSAPGLPVADCGGGIMKECLNMIIRPGKLQLRKKMQDWLQSPFAYGPCPNGEIGNDFVYLYNKGREIIIGVKTAGSDIGSIAALYYIPKVGARLFKMETDVYAMNVKDLNLDDYFGSLSLLYTVYQMTGPEGPQTFASSCIMDFGTKDGISRIRQLGMVPPNALKGNTIGDISVSIGIEYVEMDSQNIPIRSSGITISETRENLNSTNTIGYNLNSNPFATHVRIWRSNDIDYPANAGLRAEGNPHQLFLLFTIPIEDFIPGRTFDPYEGRLILNIVSVMQNNAIMFILQNNDEFSTRTQASEVSLESTAGDLSEINLIPMENAICYSGGRLWGMLDRKLIFSSLAGTIHQEQRDPLSIIDLGLGDIKDIKALNGDLYVFCERGVSLIRESDPGTPNNPNPPQPISNIGAVNSKIFSVDGFGIFALTNDKLLFLDSGTREYSMNCREFNLNYLLGNIAKETTDFEFYEGMLFFIANNRLFVFNMLENRGLSEFCMSSVIIPERLEYADGIGLMITFRNPDGTASVRLYGGNPANATEGEIIYNATFAVKAVNGWVEHWNTSVYAKLTPGSIIGMEDTCDGLVYAFSESMNKTSEANIDTPWEYRITPGRFNGIRRPIGKTIGIRININNISNKEENYISQVKLTTATQTEVFRRDFNPNAVRTYETN